jgi:hypothetical protein
MPKGRSNSTTVRLYNLAKKKEQQRMSSNDPGARKGTTKSNKKMMEETMAATRKRAKEQALQKAKKQTPSAKIKSKMPRIANQYKRK